MQITRETAPQSNLIRAVEHGRVRIGEHWLSRSLIVTADTIVADWTPAEPGRIRIDDLAPALRLRPELVIIGAGMEPCPPDIDLMAELAERSIGLEFMHTPAACRTYNVLVHEGRRVAAALILDRRSA